MNTIDERVVQMQFNNAQFENGVQTSIKSLDLLKKSLNLEGAAKGLSDLDKAGRSFSLDGIGRGVEAMQAKFTTLEIMGVTALANITNSAVNAGKRIVSALTIDPIKTGFTEYETKMNAIQTILTNTASKGTTIEDVNKVLGELNEYSDKTIYNFAEMTRNIGTFTAAGIDLKTSATAIKGIANLAAGSGSNAQQAATAMYQLSQALASGSVKLMDWNSVVNAGMGGELFQNALKKTAKEMGIVVNTAKPFRETLQDGWLTADVLTKTLEKFANDASLIKAATEVKTFTQLIDTMKESVQSGWAVTWENIIGTKDEAAKTLTAINDVFGRIVGSSADARNNTLAFWKAQGGRDTMIDALANAFKGLGSILKPIGEAFKSVFPAITGSRLIEITNAFHGLMAQFKIGEKTSENIRNTFKGIFTILDVVRQAIVGAIGVFAGLFKVLLPIADIMFTIGGAFGKYISSVNEAAKASGVFKGIGDGLNAAFSGLANIIQGFATAVSIAFEELGNGIDNFAGRMKERFAPFKAMGDLVETVANKIDGVLSKLSPKLERVGQAIANAFGAMQTAMSNSMKNFDASGALDVLNAGLFTTILLGIKKLMGGFDDFVKEGIPLKKNLMDILDGVRGSLEAYQSNLQAKTLLTIAGAIGILSVALIALSMVDPKRLTGALAAIGGLFAELFISMALFEKATAGAKFKGVYKLAGAMVVLSTAILLLSFAMRNLSGLDWNQTVRGLIAIAALSGIMVAASIGFDKAGKKLMRGSAGLVVFAAAVKILADVVQELGTLNPETLTKGLVSIAVLVTTLSIFLNKTQLEKSSLGKGVGLIALAVALNILAAAVEKFGSLNAQQLVKGLGAMTVVLTALSIFVNQTTNPKGVVSTAIGLTILGVAMNIFAKAIGQMGSMPLENIVKGLSAMGGALLAIVLAMGKMPPNMIGSSIAMIGISTAILILSNALEAMGKMNPTEIIKSLIMLGGALGVIAVAMNAMTGALPGAAALLVVSGALAILAPVLKTLGSMSLSEIGLGLLAIAGVFTVMGVAGLVLAPLIPVLFGLGGAMALLGIGVAAVGGGVLAFSAGMTALAISGTAGAASLVVVVTSIASLIPMLAVKLGEGIVALAGVITAGAPAIAAAIVAVVTSLAQTIRTAVPEVVKTLMVLLDTLLNSIVKYVPKLVDAGMQIVIGFLDGIAKNIGKVVESGVNIIVNFINGIAKQIPRVIQAGFDLILAFINGLTDAIRGNTPKVMDAMKNLINAMFESAVKIITDPIKGAISIGKNIVDGIVTGVKNFFSSGVEAMKNLGGGLLTAIQNKLGINSPSRVMRDEVGRYIVDGIAEGITKNMSAEEAAEKKASNIVNAFKDALSKIDLGTSISELENKLWGMKDGATASNTVKNDKAMELLSIKLKAQQEKAALAKAEYDNMVKTLGSSSNQAKESYKKYLEEQIALEEISKQVSEARNANAQDQKTAYVKYYEWLSQNQAALLKLGYTLEEIDKVAREETGLDPVKMEEDMSKNVKTAVTAAMTTVKTTYEEKSVKTFGGLLNSFATWGGTYANGIGDTFLANLKTIMDKIKETLDEDGKTLNQQVQTIVSQLHSLTNSDMSASPTIRPVMDLSNIKAGTKQMNDLITSGSGGKTGIVVSGIKNVASGIASSIGKVLGLVDPSKESKTSGGTSISLTQNNYSPKALSRTEIYRQTKNQISTLKGLVS